MYRFEEPLDEFIGGFKISDRELAQQFQGKVKIIRDFLSLENYDLDIIQILKDKKKAEAAYLYELASKKDISDEIRIPAKHFQIYANMPNERLREFEPILMSKRDIGLWSYSSDYILSLRNLDTEKLKLFTELTKCNVTPFSTNAVITHPDLNWENILEKAQALKNYYGKTLREVEFYSNRKGENFFLADIQLPHSENKPDWLNFKRITVKLDDDANPVSRNKTKTKINKYVDNIYQKAINKLEIFEEKDLEKAITEVKQTLPDATEQEIIEVMQKLTQFSSYKSIKKIGEELNKAKFTELAKVGELYPYFNYFQNSKKLFSLNPEIDKKIGILFSKNDLENTELMTTLKKGKNHPIFENVEFINLEGFSDGINLFNDNQKLAEKTTKVLAEAKTIQMTNPNLTFKECVENALNNKLETQLKRYGFKVFTIRENNPPTKDVILNQMQPIKPTKSQISASIETIADYYTMERFGYRRLSKSIASYYDNNVNIYSKQSMIEDLKRLNQKIDTYLKENNLPKENLYLITGETDDPKSFDIVNKMYKDLFNIDENKIIKVSNILSLNLCPPDSTFLILDDIAGTGTSMVEIGNYYRNAKSLLPNKHIIFAPISATKEGISNINNNIALSRRKNADTVIYLDKNITSNEYSKNILNNTLIKLKLKLFKSTEILSKGYEDQGLCTAFPYMSPDNNSAISSNFVNLFLPNSECIKTKPKEFGMLAENTVYYNLFGQPKSNLKANSTNENPQSFIRKIINFFSEKGNNTPKTQL